MANTQHDQKLATPHYALSYGMRLDKGTAPELVHPHVQITLPDRSEGSMALYVINGAPDEIKARLLESVDAFFEMFAEAGLRVP